VPLILPIFLPPSGTCIKVYPTPTNPNNRLHVKDSIDFLGSVVSQSPLVSALKSVDPIQAMNDKVNIAYHRQKLSREVIQKRLTNQGPLPPKLNQTFTARWTLNASTDLNPPYTPYTLSGNLAFDFKVSGLSWSIDSTTGNIPLDLTMEWRINPSMNGIEWLQVGPDGSCWSYVFFAMALDIFSFPSLKYHTTQENKELLWLMVTPALSGKPLLIGTTISRNCM